MSYSKKELEKQESEVRKNLLFVFIPVILLLLTIGIYQSNSLDYNEKKYFEKRNLEFNGKVISKNEEGDYVRARRSVILDSYYEQVVNNEIYYKIEIGDSVYKKKGNDSIYFHLKSGEIIIENNYEHLRKKYEELLNKK